MSAPAPAAATSSSSSAAHALTNTNPAASSSSTPALSAAAAAAASISSSSSSALPAPDVDSFLRELSTLERDTEVARITNAFKYNPYELLNIPHTAQRDAVSKAYRSASLQVHPDKFPLGESRDKAQHAFTLLAAAKDELLDEEKKDVLDALIDQARQRVLTNKAAQGGGKKRKTEEGEDYDLANDPEYDNWIRAEYKELIIEREWRKRQLLKAAAAEDVLAAEEKARRAAERAAKEAETKNWEEGRDKRINSWRDFQKGGKKKLGGMMRPPKTSASDAENTYIKRPVAHQSSEK